MLKTSEPNAGESIDHRSESPRDSQEYLALRDKALVVLHLRALFGEVSIS